MVKMANGTAAANGGNKTNGDTKRKSVGGTVRVIYFIPRYEWGGRFFGGGAWRRWPAVANFDRRTKKYTPVPRRSRFIVIVIIGRGHLVHGDRVNFNETKNSEIITTGLLFRYDSGKTVGQATL